MTRLLLITALAALGATPALAEPASSTVMISASDFVSPSARAALDRRIAAAIEEQCRSYAVVEPYQWDEVTACRTAAKSEVDTQLDRIAAASSVRLGSR
jgi:UrcA family protein